MTDSQLNIFLIDDNDIDIVVNSKLLKLARITENISTFSECDSALAFFSENKDRLVGQRNVILLDIQMPNMDGFECVEHLSRFPEDLKDSLTIFMLSSSIDRNDIRRAEEHSYIKKILEKPLDVYQLKRLLES